ncbi:MAG: aromatase/cyclase [Acidobacteriota bacterium]|nr:aromatase/cyclase [Acidobacteriota bacterium]
MRELAIEVMVPDRKVEEVYEILCDFKRYPDYTPEVRSVTLESSGGEHFSTWETTFRGGILRWRERDSFDPVTNTIGFEQTEGDIEQFSGWWKIDGENGGSSVRFRAQFDMGIPSLSDIIDPIAEQALRENIIAILRGLFGPQVVVLPAAG